MKNKKRTLGLLIILMLFATACASKKEGNSNNNNNQNSNNSNQNTNKVNFDVPYFGDITVGSVTFNMLSTDDEIEEKGMERGMMNLLKYEDEETDSYIYYDVEDYDDSLSINFATHNSIYQDLGCDECDDAMSSYVRLPKNITYDSTIDDVISAYGNPRTNELYQDDSQQYSDNTLTGEKFGKLECYRLQYNPKNDYYPPRFILYLYFSKDTKKLYMVEYEISIDK